ncbi:MAG TPA: glycerol-3-phosphate dehydrogenase/oxidase [Bacteroidales bacterium]|jgi:glycerol-3-phosphate dehydrogenase|nr:glycerol-3-phosphate dehydrogenase/oxidase [Bacteroidales bacterium]
MNRNDLLNSLLENNDRQWDIIVIGGGATGLGIALDAVTRGYRTILFEQSDFSAGTSSRSTKLVHGGVRYLAQGDILLVKEALHERGLMLNNAPHLTSDQEFIIPAYTWFDCMLYTVGLKFYDFLAGRLSMGRSYFISGPEVKSRLPLINPKGLKGGIVYHDGQFDDSRMAIALADAFVNRGGIALNYFRVTGLLKDGNNRISGVMTSDMNSGQEHLVRGRLVINATGVFADEIHRMDDPMSKPTIRPSQGIHLVLDGSFLQSRSALMIPKTDDGRVLFAIPWFGKVVTGTTDTPLDRISREPRALDSEIDFILGTAGRYLVRMPGRDDILCIFAGLRPLAADPANPGSTREISRRHKIIISRSGLLSIVGGKWTSYRRMAEETIDRGIKAGMLPYRKCVTRNLKLYDNNQVLKAERLKIYGNRAKEIENMTDEDPELGVRISSKLPYTRAEIIWICRNEMPLTLEDMLARRTRALILDARASLEMAPETARLMAGEMGFDEKWVTEQTNAYGQLIESYL